MVNIIKTLLKYVILPITVLLLLIIIIGGGFGNKDDLPSVITSLKRPVLFAHRGVSQNYPENSSNAVSDALILGFPAVELDVQFSSDSVFFTHHDRDIQLSPNSTFKAEDLIISDKKIPVDKRAEQMGMRMRVSKLSDCILPNKFHLIYYLDMKRYGHDSIFRLAKDISGFLKKHNLEQTCLVASAHVFFISYLEFTNPEIITVLEGIDTENPWLYNCIPKNFKPDMIASRQAAINDDFIQWMQDNNLLSRYIVYHGNDTTFLKDIDRGIEMFIVDYASYLDTFLNIN